MKVKIAVMIKSEIEYDAALERVNELWDAARDTPEGVERDALFAAIERYEAEHYPIGEPESYAAVEYHLERLNLRIDQLPIPDRDKAILSECLANNLLIPDKMLVELSGIFNVPREALGVADPSGKSTIKHPSVALSYTITKSTE